MSAFLRRQAMQIYQQLTGRQILNRLDELNETQWLNQDALKVLQRNKLRSLLRYAYQYVPYYHRLFDRVGFQPDAVLSDPHSIRKIPLLTKSIIRENFKDLLTTEPARRRTLSKLTTGGSTGRPLIFMQDTAFRDYVTADIHRHLGWAGWQWGKAHAYIWGANFEVKAAQSLRARLMNWTLNRFVTNAYVLSEESMAQFSAEIRRRRPRILFGYPSTLYRYAEFVCDNRLDDIKFEALLSSSEVLYPAQRRFIENIFNGKLFNHYGTRELGAIGCECEAHSGLHTSPENNYIEILQASGGNEPAPPGKAGRIVVTNLNNYGMPFIRYSLDDLVSWSLKTDCACGRALPMLSIVEGRQNDMFKTRDGKMVWGGITNPLWEVKGLRQFQVIQKTYDWIVVRVVNDNGSLSRSTKDKVRRAIQAALGENIRVEFHFPKSIAVESSGKYRYQICEVYDEIP